MPVQTIDTDKLKMIFQIKTDPAGIILFAGASNVLGQDCVEVSKAQLDEVEANWGYRKWTGTSIVPYTPPPAAVTPAQVDAERDRRIADGFMFGGALYQAREKDIRNINGAATGAALALMQGAQPGDLRWQGGETDFGWIAADNSIVPMDVVTMVQFGRAAMGHVERLTMAGRALKNRIGEGEVLDVNSDALWN